MKHYHGLPITPNTAAIEAIKDGYAFVSYIHSGQLQTAIDYSKGFCIDNGAFSAWKSGKPIKDWSKFYEFASKCLEHPNCDWIVIPDVIDGNESDNDALLLECPIHKDFAVPVYHMHESLGRLERMAGDYDRIALGSSGEFAVVGTNAWWERMNQMMEVLCDKDGFPLIKLHGLRMLDERIFTKLPLESADSTNIGRNIGIDKNWTGSYQPKTKEFRALTLRHRIEFEKSAEKYIPQQTFNQISVFDDVFR